MGTERTRIKSRVKLRIGGRTLDRELGVGHDGPKPILPEVAVKAVPSGADDRVTGRWSRRDRLRFGQDALCRSPSVEHHSIDLVTEDGDLLLEPVDVVGLADELLHGVELNGEVRHRHVDFLLPRRDLRSLLLERLDAVAGGVVARLQALEPLVDDIEAAIEVVAHLLHLVEEELGSGVHGAVDVLLETGEMVVAEIQPGNN
jgi:hypothetical protein